MLKMLGNAGIVVAALVATAGSTSAQTPGPGGVTYDFTMSNGPGGGTVRMQGTVTGMNGGAMIRQCVQPPGSPMQLCQMSVNGQSSPPFAAPAFGPSGVPAPGWPPSGAMPPRWPPFAGAPFPGGGMHGYGTYQAPDGFQVSGQGRWGPYAGSGTFSYQRPPW